MVGNPVYTFQMMYLRESLFVPDGCSSRNVSSLILISTFLLLRRNQMRDENSKRKWLDMEVILSG